MAVLYYIDNEVPDFGEWDAIVEDAPSSIAQSTAAGFPERGQVGLRVEVASSAAAYAQKDLPAEQEVLAVGFWLHLPQIPQWGPTGWPWMKLCRAVQTDTGVATMELFVQPDTTGVLLQLQQETAYSLNVVNDDLPLVTDRWYYVVALAHWGQQECTVKLYVDGALRGEDSEAGSGADLRPDRVKLGCTQAYYLTSSVFHLDEVKLATSETYPEPFSKSPAPTGPEFQYPEPRRTVVLFRQSSLNSQRLADHCVTQLGVPRGNLCPLPGCSADETLPDYATFQSEVEDDLLAWLGRNPTAAGRCTCLLVGHGVPGYFLSGDPAKKHSATSRLMNLSGAFSSGTANPLYKPAAVARLTRADLSQNGLYLAARIDAPTLADAKQIVDRAVAVSALPNGCLDPDDVLYCDDAEYRASPACAELRLATAPLGLFKTDAFVWGATGVEGPEFGAAGARAAFADTGAASASTLRATASMKPCGKALFDADYAAAVGSAEDAETFDPESFFEMLRIGGTLAEAVAVAAAHLDYTSVAAGVGTMAVTTPYGYEIYGPGATPEAINLTTPAATAVPGSTSRQIALGSALVAGRDYWFAVRAESAAGVESEVAYTRVRIDEAEDLVGPPPNRLAAAVAEPVANAALRVRVAYSARDALGDVAAIQVARADALGQVNWEPPLATLPITGTGTRSTEISPESGGWAHGDRVVLAACAVTADGVAGAVTWMAPVSPDARGPAAIGYIEAEQQT